MTRLMAYIFHGRLLLVNRKLRLYNRITITRMLELLPGREFLLSVLFLAHHENTTPLVRVE